MKVIGAGLVTADIIQACESDFRPIKARRPAYASGGTVCNILCYLATFGWRCHVIGGVGDDDMAEVVTKDLRSAGIDTTGLVRRAGTSTRRFAHMIATEGGNKGRHEFQDRCFVCHREFGPFQPPRFEQVEGLPCLESLEDSVLVIDRANDLTLKLAELTSAAGGMVVFEPGYISRDSEVVERIFLHVDILKYSEELRWKNKKFAEVMPRARPRLKLVIETRSQKGVRFIIGNSEYRITTTPITSWVDRAGAGDAFMAGFLTGVGPDLLHKLPSLDADTIEAAIQRGQAFGGLACMFLGSKGLLNAKTVREIEDAVAQTIEMLRAPSDFGEESLFEGIPLRAPKAAACPTCRLG